MSISMFARLDGRFDAIASWVCVVSSDYDREGSIAARILPRISRTKPLIALCTATLLGVCMPSEAAEISGALTVSTEYVYRGQAVSGHDPSVAFGVDAEYENGVFAGLWGSTIDIEGVAGSRDRELDFYLGYRFGLEAPVDLAARVLRYTYPGHEGRVDYEYTEWAVSASVLDYFTLDFAWSADFYGLGASGRHLELRSDWSGGDYWIVGGGIGIADINVLGTPAYWFWDFGATTRYSRITFDVRWYDNETIVGPFRNWSAGSRLVASFAVTF